MVDGKPNFLTIAHIGIVNHAKPYLISVSLGKVHYTNAGIKENKAFSVNIPSEELVAAVCLKFFTVNWIMRP
jgi:flavin reductase (DIM6/NTAB) family NADH-FMN oxidoreductase RutF